MPDSHVKSTIHEFGMDAISKKLHQISTEFGRVTFEDSKSVEFK